MRQPTRDLGVLVQVLVSLGVGALVVSVVGLGRDYLYARVTNRLVSDLRA